MDKKRENRLFYMMDLFFVAGITTGTALLFFIQKMIQQGIIMSLLSVAMLLIIYLLLRPYKVIMIGKNELD